MDGWDSVLSILQMPNGIPVATVALNGAKNAGILAASILSIEDEIIASKLQEYKTQMQQAVEGKAEELSKKWANNFDKK